MVVGCPCFVRFLRFQTVPHIFGLGIVQDIALQFLFPLYRRFNGFQFCGAALEIRIGGGVLFVTTTAHKPGLGKLPRHFLQQQECAVCQKWAQKKQQIFSDLLLVYRCDGRRVFSFSIH